MTLSSQKHAPLLLVEDDDDIRADLASLLQGEGYDVVSACNGKEGLAWLLACEALRPCIILLDLMMPVMNGWEFREEQLKHPAHANIPVILLSGVANARQEARELGAIAALAKPFSVNQLLELIERHC